MRASRVPPTSRVGDDWIKTDFSGCGGPLLDEDVVAGAAIEDVEPGAADEHVVSRIAAEGVIAVAADQNIVAVAAIGGKLDGARREPRRLDRRHRRRAH